VLKISLGVSTDVTVFEEIEPPVAGRWLFHCLICLFVEVGVMKFVDQAVDRRHLCLRRARPPEGFHLVHASPRVACFLAADLIACHS
jgi:hypothetical protein